MRKTLSAADGTSFIIISGSIPAGRYFLLECTDHDTVPEVGPGVIYAVDMYLTLYRLAVDGH